MIKIFILLFVLSSILLGGDGRQFIPITNCQQGADANTVGLWHFNEQQGETCYDVSGSGNNGTINGSVTYIDSLWGTCLDFGSTTNNHVTLTTRITLETNATCMAWVFTKRATPALFISIFGDDGGYNYVGGGNHSILYVGAPYNQVFWTFASIYNNWHHICFVKKGTDWEMFRDGISQGHKTLSPTPTIKYIGEGEVGMVYRAVTDGLIEEPHIINGKALSQAEIVNIISRQSGARQ